jgi:hypothetical protein
VRSSKSLTRGSSILRKAGVVVAVSSGLVLAGSATAFAATTVTGTVTCYWPNADGTTTFSVGYVNTGATTVTIPVGANNYVTPSPQDRGQPTTFLAGSHPNVWAPSLTPTDLANNPNWFINGVATSYTGTLTQCPSKPVSVDGSTAGYLGATAAVVGIGAYIIASPRRRRGLVGLSRRTAASTAV